MPKACDLKRGMIVEINGAPHAVEDIFVQTPSARGGASLYKIRFRNLVTKQKDDKSLKGDDALKGVDFQRREVQFSYVDQDDYVFTDLSDYSEINLSVSMIDYERKFLSDGLEGITALIAEGRVLGIELPDVVELPISECGPPLKGASATARTKPATLTTGLVVQVPEYMAQGERIRVDTRTAKYLSRA